MDSSPVHGGANKPLYTVIPWARVLSGILPHCLDSAFPSEGAGRLLTNNDRGSGIDE